jgi:hypothetical protein
MNLKLWSRRILSVALYFGLICSVRAVMPVDLHNVGTFALGGIGAAGTMSAGERALREILKRPDAVTRLEALLPGASPAGKLYILLGLHLRDRAACERALEKFRDLDLKVETARGCMLGQEPFRNLVKEIERGQYDAALSRDWPGPDR